MKRSQSRKSAAAAATSRAPRPGRLPSLFRQAPIAAAVLAAIQGAHAQDRTDDTGLAQVVVTASKRTENQQDVPISITTLDGEKLEQQHIQNFNDYAQSIPEVSFQSVVPGFARTFMRGIASDNNPNHSGPLPSVGTYLDEQPITTIQGALDMHLYDIARVEVLPGPQGTLYGASSEAGTVRIITNKPDPSGFSAGYNVQGNTIKNGTGGGSAEGFVNVPLGENAAVRLVGWYEHDSGYIDNVHGTLTYPDSPGPNTNCGGVTPTCSTIDNHAVAHDHYNPVDTYGARAALKVNLNDNWTISPTLIAQKTRWGGIFGQEEWKDLADGSPVPNELSVKHFYPEDGSDSWVDAALTVEGKIGDFDITYAGAYLKRTDHTQSDYSDYSLAYESAAAYWPNNPTQVILGTDRYQMFSNELRLTTPKEWPVRFVGGLFQQRQQHNILQNYTINGLDPLYAVGAGTSYLWPSTFWLTQQQRVNRDDAVFGELTWDMGSHLTGTAGVRHFHYKNTLEGFYGFGLNAFGSNPDLLPLSVLQQDPDFSGSSGQQLCFITTPFHGAPCEDLHARSDGSGWTPKFNLSYKIDAAHMLYLTYSKGFRPGGANRIGAAIPYQADFLKNFEAGWKTSWLDNHLRFNGALFYEQWNNFQFSFLGPNSVTIVANAAQARVKGAETEIEWAASRGLTLSAGAAYIDAYLSKNYCNALNDDGTPVTDCVDPPAPAGQQLPTTPKFKGNLAARYAFPLKGGYQAHVQANFVYQSAVWADLRTVERNILGQQGSYGLTNFSFGVDRDNWSAELLVKNAFDVRGSQYRYAECTQATCGPFAVYDVVAPPRLIGLEFGQKF